MDRQKFQQGLKDGLPICLGYFPVSFAYGMSVVLSGMPAWAAVLISLTNLTSAGQFAGSSLMLAGGSYLEIAVTTVVINIRYFLMSLAMSQKTDKKMTWIQRLLVSFGITDAPSGSPGGSGCRHHCAACEKEETGTFHRAFCRSFELLLCIFSGIFRSLRRLGNYHYHDCGKCRCSTAVPGRRGGSQ